MQKSYQYILLDWDGNIAKTLHIWMDSLRVVLARHGVERSDYELGKSLGAFTAYAKEDWMLDIDVLWPELDAYARDHLPNVELYPDALYTIEKLYDAGKNLALITTSPHKNVSGLLNKYDLMKYFETIVAHEDTVRHKPHPEPLELSLARMNGNKESAIMVGDSDKDLAAAKNFGCDSVLFYPPEHSRFYELDDLKAHSPTYTVSDFRKIIEITN